MTFGVAHVDTYLYIHTGCVNNNMPPSIDGLKTMCIYYVHIGIHSELHVMGQDSTRPLASLSVGCCIAAMSQL